MIDNKNDLTHEKTTNETKSEAKLTASGSKEIKLDITKPIKPFFPKSMTNTNNE